MIILSIAQVALIDMLIIIFVHACQVSRRAMRFIFIYISLLRLERLAADLLLCCKAQSY